MVSGFGAVSRNSATNLGLGNVSTFIHYLSFTIHHLPITFCLFDKEKGLHLH